MKRANNTQFKILYGSVVSAGLVIISIAGYRLIHDPVPYSWIVLSLLTVAAGSLSIKIPGVNGRASIGDALITLSVLLFGPLAGSVTAALEGIAGSLRCRTRSRRLRFLMFNASVMAVSVYTAGLVLHAIQGQTLFDHGQVAASPILPGPLMVFAVTYFAVNTFLVATASALDKSANVLQTWREGFLWTVVNYVAAAFISGLLVQFGHPVTLPAVATLVVGCGCVYVSAQTHIRLARQVQNLKEKAASSDSTSCSTLK